MQDLEKENILLRHRLKELKEAVEQLTKSTKKMRIAQGDAFRYGGNTFRNKARVLQRDVDKLVAHIETNILSRKPDLFSIERK